MAKRGLGSADQATRQRVARLGGLARRKSINANKSLKIEEPEPFLM